ncbi:MAG: hypothetical protein ACE5KF_03595 [Kiloniellaceae bacterium]
MTISKAWRDDICPAQFSAIVILPLSGGSAVSAAGATNPAQQTKKTATAANRAVDPLALAAFLERPQAKLQIGA